jgi:F-type H+-transporting ATPase subunit b
MEYMQQNIHYMSGVNLDLDLTFLIQLVVVVVLMFVFKQWVFTPYLKSLDERDRRTGETRDDAGSIKAEAEALAVRYEASLVDARKAAMEAKRKLRSDGIDEKDTLIGAARSEATRTVEAAQSAIAVQVAGERKLLDEQVSDLAAALVEKVIGRRV